eukprot:m.214798 g.214798  ORF g.214798 m.214798 type:complete len:1037 (+) comp17196_c0_seq50:1117-4227(+)
MLAPFMEVLLGLIYPFNWQHPYIPVCPEHIVECVQIPWPLLAGLDSALKREVLAEIDTEFPPVVVDLDLGTVEVGATHTSPTTILPELPRHVTTQYELHLAPLRQFFSLEAYGKVMLGYRDDKQARDKHATKCNNLIREAFIKMMVTLFGSVRSCLDFSNDTPLFDKDRFIQMTPEESHGFYKGFMDTSCFNMFLNSRKSEERDHFDIMCETKQGQVVYQPPTVLQCPDLARLTLYSRQSSSNGSAQDPAQQLSQSLAPRYASTSSIESATNHSESRRRAVSSSNVHDMVHPLPKELQTFTKAMLDLLNHSIDVSKGTDGLASYLYLRGVYHLARGSFQEAIKDWDTLSKAAPLSFPTREITLSLARLPEIQVATLKESVIVQRSTRWKSLFATVKKLLNTSPSSIAEILEEEALEGLQVGSSDSVIESLLQQDTIDEQEFTTLTKFLCICNTAYARQLYKALAPESDPSLGVSVSTFQRFYDEWRRSMAVPAIQLPTTVELYTRESVIKHQPMVRNKELGIGTLILTHLHILFLRSSTTCLQLCRIDSISKVDLETSSRMKRIRMTLKPVKQAKGTKKRAPVAPHAGLLELDLGFVMGAETWYYYIKELKEGNMFAVSTGDTSAVLQAAQNIALAETVAAVSVSPGPTSPLKRRFSRNSSMGSDFIAESKATQQLLRFSSDKSKGMEKTAPVRSNYVKQIDASPDQRKKTTTECMVHFPGPPAQVWCGMGDGQVKIYRMPSLQFLQSLPLHPKRITDMCRVDQTIWTCSFDRKIKVVDGKSFRTLEEARFDDIIAQLRQTRDGYIWATQLGGLLYKFKKGSLTPIQTVELYGFPTRISSCAVATVRDSLWVACGSCLVVLDTNTLQGDKCRVRGQPESAAQTPTSALISPGVLDGSADGLASGDKSLRRTIASAAANGLTRGANREVWSFSAVTGLLEIRSGLELEVVQCGGVWRLDCNGFNDLVRAYKCMWAAANNGAVFVFDLVTHSMLRQLEVHVDSVRALCYIPDDNDECEFVTSGSGSADGTIILWQYQL